MKLPTVYLVTGILLISLHVAAKLIYPEIPIQVLILAVAVVVAALAMSYTVTRLRWYVGYAIGVQSTVVVSSLVALLTSYFAGESSRHNLAILLILLIWSAQILLVTLITFVSRRNTQASATLPEYPNADTSKSDRNSDA